MTDKTVLDAIDALIAEKIYPIKQALDRSLCQQDSLIAKVGAVSRIFDMDRSKVDRLEKVLEDVQQQLTKLQEIETLIKLTKEVNNAS